MTRADRELSPDIFYRGEPLVLYRLARLRYANLSGAGAAAVGGRWNRIGQEAIYTSVETGVPILERLAHTPKDLIPSNLALMTIRVSGNWSREKHTLLDPATLGRIVIFTTIRDAEESFSHDLIDMALPFAVAVPSVIAPAWNVVLYPTGIGFWEHVTLESVEPFKFDPRLFPESAEWETEL